MARISQTLALASMISVAGMSASQAAGAFSIAPVGSPQGFGLSSQNGTSNIGACPAFIITATGLGYPGCGTSNQLQAGISNGLNTPLGSGTYNGQSGGAAQANGIGANPPHITSGSGSNPNPTASGGNSGTPIGLLPPFPTGTGSNSNPTTSGGNSGTPIGLLPPFPTGTGSNTQTGPQASGGLCGSGGMLGTGKCIPTGRSVMCTTAPQTVSCSGGTETDQVTTCDDGTSTTVKGKCIAPTPTPEKKIKSICIVEGSANWIVSPFPTVSFGGTEKSNSSADWKLLVSSKKRTLYNDGSEDISSGQTYTYAGTVYTVSISNSNGWSMWATQVFKSTIINDTSDSNILKLFGQTCFDYKFTGPVNASGWPDSQW